MFDPRLAAASLSGESDAEWAIDAAPYVGCAFLGGIALDDETRRGAQALVERDRTEFLPEDPIRFIDRQLSALDDGDFRPAFNVRSATLDPVEKAAEVCAAHDAILEVNAHCRQDEMCAVGAGEALLRDADRLCEQVATASDAGATVSVKLRAELDGVELPVLSRRLADSGADALHVDAMDSEPIVSEIVAAAPDAFVIANNGVRDRETAHEYFGYGADAVSVGRPSDDPVVLHRVRRAVDAWFADRDSAEHGPDSGAVSDA